MSLTVEPDQEFRVLGGEIELEDGLLDELVQGLVGVFLKMC